LTLDASLQRYDWKRVPLRGSRVRDALLRHCRRPFWRNGENGFDTMALHYLDTSALVKRYVAEQGSAWVEALAASEPVAVSSLAAVELASALARRTREGDLTLEERDSIFRSFIEDARQYVMLAVTKPMTEDTATILLTSPASIPLRALDALHLAAARVAFASARRRGVATGSFITADRTLTQAVTWAGLTAVNPEGYS
jgi:uncharacterized protein